MQVRFREKEKHKPLPEAVFRPYLQHYDGLKFDLQLTTKQTAEILKLFEGDRYAGPLPPELESRWKQMKDSLSKSGRKENNATTDRRHHDLGSDQKAKGRKASHTANFRAKEKDTKPEERRGGSEDVKREAGEHSVPREAQASNSQRPSISLSQTMAWNNQRSLADMLRNGKDDNGTHEDFSQSSKNAPNKDSRSSVTDVEEQYRESAEDRGYSSSNVKAEEGTTQKETRRSSRAEDTGALTDSSNSSSRENKVHQEKQSSQKKREDTDAAESKKAVANGGDHQNSVFNHDSTSKPKGLDTSKAHSDANGNGEKAADDKKDEPTKSNPWKSQFSAAHKLRNMHVEPETRAPSKKPDTEKRPKDSRPKVDNAAAKGSGHGRSDNEPSQASSGNEHSHRSDDHNQANGAVKVANGDIHEHNNADGSMAMAERAQFLTREIEVYVKKIKPSKRIRRIVNRLVDLVRKSVSSLWNGADVELFGSFSTGLCLKHSDVDLAVINAPPVPSHPPNVLPCPPPEHSTLRGLIRSLAAYLENKSWCKEIKTIDTAYMPVIKLRARPADVLENEQLLENKREVSEEEANFFVAVDITIMQRRCSSFPDGSIVPPVHFNGKDVHEMKKLFPAWKPGPPLTAPSMYVHEHNGAMERDWIKSKLIQMPQLESLVCKPP